MIDAASLAAWYSPVKLTHIALAAFSGAGFVVHGVLMWCESPRQHAVWFRYGTHGVDSLLLGSAILLAWLTRQAPWEIDWLGMKIGILLAYIVCGAIALKRGPSLRIRQVFLIVALLLYAQIIAIAVTRNPAGLLGWLS